MMKKTNFLLDMDGVLVDFISGAIKSLNKAYDKNHTLEEYIADRGGWNVNDYYRISIADFWKVIDGEPNFWLDLYPLPWHKQLYSALLELGEVTVITTPSSDPKCSAQKLEWLYEHLEIKSEEVFLGSRKYLMAGNGLLIDDYAKNVNMFRENGGSAVLVSSNWNTLDLTFDIVMKEILDEVKLKPKMIMDKNVKIIHSPIGCGCRSDSAQCMHSKTLKRSYMNNLCVPITKFPDWCPLDSCASQLNQK